MKIFQIRLRLQIGKHLRFKTSSIKISILRFYFPVRITPNWILVQNVTHILACIKQYLRGRMRPSIPILIVRRPTLFCRNDIRALSCARAPIPTSPTGDPRRTIACGCRAVASLTSTSTSVEEGPRWPPRVTGRQASCACIPHSRSLVIARSLLGLLTIAAPSRPDVRRCHRSAREDSRLSWPRRFDCLFR